MENEIHSLRRRRTSFALAMIDLDVHRLPNKIVLPSYGVVLALLVLASLGNDDWDALLRAAIGGAALYALYFLLRLGYPSGMGFGDVKLAGLLGMDLGWLGWGQLAVGAFLGFLLGGLVGGALMVANRAKEGCEAIGADPVLGYAAGLYHDVGKVLRPDYFIENQRPGHNRHDKLLPSMSALILINHVKDGIELARQHNLPRVIADAVEQHHGTRLMKFFYSKAQEQKDPDATDVTDEKYRYPGPRPQTREMGVLMIADAVEAAYNNGILEVRIPVLEQAKPRKVEVRQGAESKELAA